MAPTTRSSKTNFEIKKEEQNVSPLKFDNKITLLSPNTTLPTKLPNQHSTYDTSTSNEMDNLMKILQEQQNLLQYNKHKLQDFELKCNSLTSTFKRFA